MSWMLLLLATVSPEVVLTTSRHTSVFWSTSIAVAPAADGFVIAWSEPTTTGRFRLLVAKANARGALGTPREMAPMSPQSRYAVDPAIAPFGDGFLVGWSEDCGTLSPSCAALRRLDASLNPIGPDYPRLFGGSAVAVRTVGNRTIVAAGTQVWPMAADGSIGVTQNNGDPIDSAGVNAAGAMVAVSHRLVTGVCTIISFCIPTTSRALFLTWFGEDGSQRSTRVFNLGAPTPVFKPAPAIASNGCCFLMAWMDRGTLMGASFRTAFDAQTQMNAPLRIAFPTEDVQPSVASDGERYLIVWSAGGEVAAAALRRDQTLEQLKIGAGRQPSVAALGPGLFVVVYDNGAGTAARFISFNQGRERAVR